MDYGSLSGYPVEKDDSGNIMPFQRPFVLMVDRGNCTFVQKVRNAQRAGAAAVLIADNTCLCAAPECVMNPTQVACQTLQPIMADDGTGANITIPSLLIMKQDADAIRKEIQDKNQPVRVEMSFRIPTPSANVEYDLWTTASDDASDAFVKTFDSAAIALKGKAKFTPQMFIYNGTRSGCTGINGRINCAGFCTNAGRYCATDPEGDLMAGNNGTDVITESLRRICIWITYGSSNSGGQEWWSYVKNFVAQCRDVDDPLKYTNISCIEDVMKMSNVDPATIEQCITASGGLTEDAPNTELEKMLSSARDVLSRIIIPSISINHATIHGALSYQNVFPAICAGYASRAIPNLCRSCQYCNDVQTCVLNNGSCQSGYRSHANPFESRNGISTKTLMILSISNVVLFILLITGCWYYRRQQRQQRMMRGETKRTAQTNSVLNDFELV
jgi:PA domain